MTTRRAASVRVRDSPWCTHPVGQVVVLGGVPAQLQPGNVRVVRPREQLVEDVEVAFSRRVVDDSGLLQQVAQNVASHRIALWSRQRSQQFIKQAGFGIATGHWTR